MDLWLVIALYAAGLGLAVAECFLPGFILGTLAAAALGTSIVFGFLNHWGVGTGQILITLVVVPVAFFAGMRRMSLKESLGGSASFAKDYSVYEGKEGETQTELRPAGIVTIDGAKLDVVTAGEMIERGRRVRVVKVEGNRIVVRAI
jgi:membrane-bound serine protease (ClpP class)